MSKQIFTKNANVEKLEPYKRRSALLPRLQEVQKQKGYISDNDMQDIADEFDIHPVEVYSVVSFYSFLTNKKHGKNIIRVSTCASSKCAGSDNVVKAFEQSLGIKAGECTKDGEFSFEKTSCLGMCDVSPAILVNDTLVGPVNPEEVEAIIKACKEGGVLPNAYTTKATKRDGKIIFSKVEAYVGLKKALDCGFDAVIKEISESNMRGRGGAGFTTGLKWKLAAEKQSDVKFVICNADEGEPGTFKDRVLLVEYAQTLFEGMVIAGYAIGATEGILYLRGEYGAFKPALEDMLEKMRQENALGNNIFGKEFNFDIKIHLGSGAYICGEETALIESLEGSRGEPRNRPPFPVNTGYNGHPTVVNNVETLIAVVHIIAKGASCFKEIGTPNSSGTKIISVSGDCKKPGVYEIEFGTSIVDILSMVGADDTKAVQVGGASGTCITKDEFKRKIAFEDLSTGGSIMIFNKTRNMLDIADNFLAFFAEESCGQCTPCREGIPVLQERLKMIQENNCDEDEFKDLFSLTETMADASKCGLGQTAPKALCDIIEKFNNEYTLLKDKKEKEIYG